MDITEYKHSKVRRKSIFYLSGLGKGKKCLESGIGWDRKGMKRKVAVSETEEFLTCG